MTTQGDSVTCSAVSFFSLTRRKMEEGETLDLQSNVSSWWGRHTCSTWEWNWIDASTLCASGVCKTCCSCLLWLATRDVILSSAAWVLTLTTTTKKNILAHRVRVGAMATIGAHLCAWNAYRMRSDPRRTNDACWGTGMDKLEKRGYFVELKYKWGAGIFWPFK